MKQDLIAIAVLSLPVLLLGLLTLRFQDKVKRFNSYFLNFSGAFLMSLLALHIIPEVYESSHDKGGFNIGIFVIVGFFIQVLLEYLSQGIEHGHIHTNDHNHSASAFPYGILISLCVHAFIEGIPIEMEIHGDFYGHAHDHAHHHHHHHSGLWSESPLLVGILIHKIPVGITLALLLIASKVKTSKAVIGLIIFSIMAPIGLLVGHFMGHSMSQDFSMILSIAQAIVMGMLLHIASTILFEADESHQKNLAKLGVMALGAGVAYLSL